MSATLGARYEIYDLRSFEATEPIPALERAREGQPDMSPANALGMMTPIFSTLRGFPLSLRRLTRVH